MTDPATDPSHPSDPARPPRVRPPDRYGDARRLSRRSLVVLAAAGLAAAVAVTGWFAVHRGSQVSWQEITYAVTADGQVSLTFQVSRPPGTVVVCTVRALSQRQTEVGLLDVRIPAASEQTSQLTTQVRTTEQAAAASVKDCAVDGG